MKALTMIIFAKLLLSTGLVLLCGACSNGVGYTGFLGTIGTTDFLAEANKAEAGQPLADYTDGEREQLAQVIQRGGKR